MVDAAEAERRRIERDLHDGAQQRLVALAMDLGMAKEKLASDPEAAAALLDEAHAESKQALVELRDLARGIHPAVLTDRGLGPALSAVAARCPVPVAVSVDIGERPDTTIEGIAYFVVSEALTNVARHSGATRASVSVTRRGDRLVIDVSDNGHGGADPELGTGIAGLRARVEGVDGWLFVSSPPGGPTSLDGGAAVRLVIAEDAVLLRAGLTRLLDDAGEEVVAAVGDAEALLDAVERQRARPRDRRRPHAADVHRRGHPRRGADPDQHPATAVLVLSQYVEQEYASELLAGNTEKVGYLLKDRVADVREFVDAVRRVADGGTALDPEVVAQLLARSRRRDPLDRLTDREREVLGLMAEGRSNRAIGDELVVSDGAVEKHVSNIFTKLDLPPGARRPPARCWPCSATWSPDRCPRRPPTRPTRPSPTPTGPRPSRRPRTRRTLGARPVIGDGAGRGSLLVIGVAFAAISVAYGCIILLDLLAWETTTVDRTFTGVEQIELASHCGGVTIVGDRPPGASTTVSRKVRRGLRGPRRRRDAARGSTLRLHSTCPVFPQTFNDVSYVVHVPSDVAVAGGAAGKIRLTDVGGPIDLRSTDGGIDVDRRRGPAHACTAASGSIHVADSSGQLVLSTSDGGIRGPRASEPHRWWPAPATAASRSTCSTPPTASTPAPATAAIDVTLPADAPAYATTTDTGDGSVTNTIRTDPNAPRTIEARTGDGSITLRLRSGG